MKCEAAHRQRGEGPLQRLKWPRTPQEDTGLLNQRNAICRVSACIRLAKQTKTDVGRVARKEEDWCWLPGYTMGTGLLPGSVQVAEWQHLLHALLGSSLHGEKQRACCRLGPRCLL